MISVDEIPWFASASRRKRYLVGVSGGADSVALLHLLVENGFRNLVICHVDHGLRGRASTADARFVRSLAEKLGLPLESTRVDIAGRMKSQHESMETAARNARHDFFGECARKYRCPRVVLAHHADDQAETVLWNLLRGSHGLRGMREIRELTPKSGSKLELVRPLLGIRRSELVEWLVSKNLRWREDASNAEPVAIRNRLRNEALPLLSGISGRDAVQAILRGAENSHEQAELVAWALSQANVLDPQGRLHVPVNGQTNAVTLTAGSNYSVIETPKTNYKLLSASCTGAANNGALSLATNSVDGIQVANGNIISCTFINTYDLVLPAYICHATGNPEQWVKNFPANSGQLMGHVGDGHQNGNDIIPPIAEILPLGQNWDTEGQAIWNNDCNIPPTTGSIKITKDVVPDDLSVWDFTISGQGGSYTIDNLGDEQSAVINGLTPGSYNITETTASGYSTTVTCGGVGPLSQNGFLGTVIAGQELECTFTNSKLPRLTIVKQVINDNGGTWTADDFEFMYDNVNYLHFTQDLTDPLKGEDTFVVPPGNYTIFEKTTPGYMTSNVGCGSITLALGETHICTFTNNDNPPAITIIKQAVNNYGGTLDSSAFPLFITKDTVNTPVVSNQTYTTFNAGTYTVSETQQTGYTLSSVTGDCTLLNGTITLLVDIGDTAQCTLINTDVQPKLEVTKHVVNSLGTGKSAADFTMQVTGTNVSNPSFAGSETGTDLTLNAGAFSVNEIYDPAEYTQSFNGDCSGTMSVGDSKSCTVTNTRNTGKIELQKDFVGSTDSVTINIGTTVSGSEVDTAALTNDGTTGENAVNTGTYFVSETVQATPGNYSSALTCYNDVNHNGIVDGGDTTHSVNPTTGEVYVGTDEDVICVFTNTRKTAPVYVNKFEDKNSDGIQGDDEGVLSGWTMNAYTNNTCTGDPVASAVTGTDGIATINGLLVGNTYWINEVLQTGWTLTTNACRQITILDTQINNRIGFGNHRDTGSITALKYIGSLQNPAASRWQFDINGTTYATDNTGRTAAVSVPTGNNYSVTEVNMPAGYSFDTAYCVNSTGQYLGTLSTTSPSIGSVTVAKNDDVFCYFTNMGSGSIAGSKFNDEDANGYWDEGENGMPSWTIYLNKKVGEVFALFASTTTNSEGGYIFQNLVPGEYQVVEASLAGWQQTTIPSVYDITITGNASIDNDFGNAILSDIHGYKWEDINGNGVRDCADVDDEQELRLYIAEYCDAWAEPLLAGWTINLYRSNGDGGFESEPSATMVTSSDSEHFGWYWFEGLLPGQYKICEVNQFGWMQTYPVDPTCHIVSLPDSNPNFYPVSLNAIFAPEYNFGNQQIIPVLTLEKSNNSTSAKRVGDIVTYTLTLTNPNDFKLGKPIVIDTPPEGFEYIPGSWTANSNIRGDLVLAGISLEPTYASPGAWLFKGLGLDDDYMAPSEIFTLNLPSKNQQFSHGWHLSRRCLCYCLV